MKKAGFTPYVLWLTGIIFLVGCTQKSGVVGQYPTIDNPAPPAEMFANPEVPLTDREKAGLTWSAGLYKRVQTYNNFAGQNNANNGYYSTVPATK